MKNLIKNKFLDKYRKSHHENDDFQIEQFKMYQYVMSIVHNKI